jgi:type I restriction enzyme S subunit
MNSEWQETNLEGLLAFSNGRSSPDRTESGPHPVYGSNGIIGYSNEANATAKTIIIGRVGSYCGSLYYSHNDCWVTDNAIAATAKDRNDPRFLFYLLTTLDLNSWRGGSGQPLLNQRVLNAIETSAPQPKTQRAISKILGDLDDKIDLLREMNRRLEDIARAVFRAWFVDFEPVRAKAAGATSFRGMPQDLFDALPNTLERHDTAEIPKGWFVELLDDLVLVPITRGLAPKYVESGGVAVLNQKCVRNWNVSFDVARRHDDVAKPPRDKVIQRYDILVNSTGVGTLGRVAQLHTLPELTTFDSHLSLVRPDAEKIAPLYLGYDLTEREEEIERLGHGSTGQTELNRQKLGGLRVIVPPMDTQLVFSDRILPLADRRAQNRVEIETLAFLRDTLLPKLISDELKAPSLENLGLKAVSNGQ